MTDLTALGLPADLPEIAAPTFMGGYDDVSADLSQQQKAAIIVRVLLSDGRTMSLSQLTPEIQVSLTREIGAIRQIVNGGAILGHGSGGIVLSRAA